MKTLARRGFFAVLAAAPAAVAAASAPAKGEPLAMTVTAEIESFDFSIRDIVREEIGRMLRRPSRKMRRPPAGHVLVEQIEPIYPFPG